VAGCFHHALFSLDQVLHRHIRRSGDPFQGGHDRPRLPHVQNHVHRVGVARCRQRGGHGTVLVQDLGELDPTMRFGRIQPVPHREHPGSVAGTDLFGVPDLLQPGQQLGASGLQFGDLHVHGVVSGQQFAATHQHRRTIIHDPKLAETADSFGAEIPLSTRGNTTFRKHGNAVG
jgi:hypothetical protein